MNTRDIREGMKVRDVRGERLGSVALCQENAFILEKGFFFPKDYTVRHGHVAELRDGEVWLSLTGEQLSAGEGYAHESTGATSVSAEPAGTEPG